MRMTSLGKCAPLKLIATVSLPHASALLMEWDHTSNGHTCKFATQPYFFTNQYLTANQKNKYIRYCLDSLNAELIPQDIEAIRSLLDSKFKSIREQYLHIDNDKKDEGDMILLGSLHPDIWEKEFYFITFPYRTRLIVAQWCFATPLCRWILIWDKKSRDRRIYIYHWFIMNNMIPLNLQWS